MLLTRRAAICRTSALCRGKKIDQTLMKIEKDALERFADWAGLFLAQDLTSLRKEHFEGYRMTPMQGREYQLLWWKDLWFSVYCCFGLASIIKRALFRSFADLTVAVERNKYTEYFSSIIESLCRDLHCYCIK